VIGLMPAENLASRLLRDAGCAVFSPESESVDEAAKWVVGVVKDPSLQAELNESTRRLAEHEFSREACADQFERILAPTSSTANR
jgi:colanic acid biosynthesis glycosyl transferase WcaI